MPDVEIGVNKKGHYAVLRITRCDPVLSEDEIIGLRDYRKKITFHVPGKCKVYCGEIEKGELLRLFLQRESTTEIKEF